MYSIVFWLFDLRFAICDLRSALCRILAATLLLGLSPATAAGQNTLFDMQKIAEGVYAAIARPQYKVNSNAAVIINDDGVLVVDSHSKPSAARALIAEIGRITDKPVRYVVNTHFHADHTRGNQAYPSAFPRGVTIISSETTREALVARGLPSVKQQLAQMPAEIEQLERRLASEQDASGREKLQGDLAQAREYLQELRSMEITLPDLTFDRSLILHKKERDIYILFLGRGHTAGDAVVYLPKEKIAATGDLLQGWWPYMADAYPPEWIETLTQLSKLDFDTFIGGHGEVKSKSHLDFFRKCIAALIEETRKAQQRGETLDQAKESVAAALAPQCEAGMGEFSTYVGIGIQRVYTDLKSKKY
ncbi:MAG: MBL fold metallo-hydrolase [Acidobacteria bacterium]|nr:MBL fold metallo-hydrolase [Acidobacteriota bacterium]